MLNDPSLSVRVLEWLKRNGRPQKEIATLLGVSESFISRAARGERSLTIEHLGLLEQRLGMPIFVVLLESDLAGIEDPAKKQMVTEALSLLRSSYELGAKLAHSAPDKGPVRKIAKTRGPVVA